MGCSSLSRYLLGPLKGGLGLAVIVVSTVFAATTGIVGASVVTMGMLSVPVLLKCGYKPSLACGMVCAGGSLGILIPPSNPMIIYGVVANTSIAGLFMAGFIPGFVLTSLMCITAYCIAKKRGYQGTNEKFSIVGLCKAIWDGKWALATPAIILGGIYWGVFTPTEAAEVGVLWTLFVGLFVYRKLTWKNISSALIRTSAFAGSATILVGVSMAFSRLLTLYHIPQTVGAFLGSISTDPTITLPAHRVLHLPVRLRGRHAGDGRGARAGVPAHHERPRHPSDPARRAVRGVLRNRVPDASFRREPVHHHEDYGREA